MNDKAKSYRNTALIAISSVINILFSIIKNKFLAIFLGPSGIGLFSILNDFINTIFSVGSLGISNSGVQAISKASTESKEEVKRVYNGLIFIYSILSIIFVAIFCVFANPISSHISQTTISKESFAWILRVASLTILFRFRSAIQSNLIIGMQRVGLLAKGTAIQGFIATIVGIVLAYFLGVKSIPFLVLSLGVASWAVTYFQSRKVLKELPNNNNRLSFKQMKPIFIIGIATTWSGLLETVVNLITKNSIINKFGENHLGYYTVAIGFTMQYISFITQSITSDYYPRLVATIAKGTNEVARFVNQQIAISMNLIMPLLFIMLTFSKLFLSILFSPKFLPANSLINYTVAGTFILVVAWPIAYVFLANRATKTYITSELIGNSSLLLLNLGAIWLANFSFLGLAYVAHYVIYLTVIIYLFYKRFDGFIVKENIKTFLLNAAIIAIIVVVKEIFIPAVTYTVGTLLIAMFFYISRKEYAFMFNSVVKKR